MEEEIPPGCRVVAWRPVLEGIDEVFHAHIVDYHYPVHCHDTWTVLIVDDGQIRYDLDTRQWGAAGTTVTILPPHVAHDGRPVNQRTGFRKRNLYLEPNFLPADLIGRAVDRSNIDDPTLRQAVSRLHDNLLDQPDALETETRLAFIAERLRIHLTATTTEFPHHEADLALRLRDYLDGHVTDRIRLSDAAALLDRSVPHMIRTFSRQYGISPHAYIIGKRIELARRQLLDGVSPAQVAARCGFVDQAHLTRHFTRHVSTTPGRYAASGRNLTATTTDRTKP